MRKAGVALLLGLLVVPAKGQDELATVVARLGSDKHAVRTVAFRELMKHKGPEMLQLLGKQIATFPFAGRQLGLNLLRRRSLEVTRTIYEDLLRVEQPFLCAASAARLSGNRQSGARHIPALAKALAAVPEAERHAVLGRTANIRDPRVLEPIRGYLHPGAGAGLVLAVLRDLLRREGGSSAATGRAVAALSESTRPEVRVTALAYLARDDRGHAKAFAELLEDQPAGFWRVRDLLDTDQRLSSPVVEVMVAALAAPRSKADITRTAVMLGRHSPGSAVAVLRGLLQHEKADFRVGALQALVNVRGGIDNEDLQPLMHAGDVEARIVAIDALRRRDDLSGLPVLLELLPGAGKHKATATQVLARFRDRKVVPVLLDLLDDKNLQVRRHAWTGVQGTMRSLFPYRRFQWKASGYQPQASSRAAGITVLRSWWASV